MNKAYAIRMLGRTQSAAARILGMSRQAVWKWPDPLPKTVEQKVRAAITTLKEQK